jgi:hypothetical protein
VISSASKLVHAMKCGAGVPVACRMSTNVSGPQDILEKPRAWPGASLFFILSFEQLAVSAVTLALKLIKGNKA